MRNFLFLFCLIVGAQAQDARLTWRLQVQITTQNNGAANSLVGQVASVIRQQDIVDPEAKSSPVEVRNNEPGGGHRVSAVYILRDEATATNVFAQLKTFKNPNLTGLVSLHCCPLEGTVKDWGGCGRGDDPRAKYQEERF